MSLSILISLIAILMLRHNGRELFIIQLGLLCRAATQLSPKYIFYFY